ncbi:hypothetical protein [Microbulbifer marinus]|uniref:Uncharacterized protein n=1 Tax=Microbulbifer marinus TaxID=658218 RepID=A0A1H4A7H7_9GAMM|nr:hypothetical protein [Microbulbifer marinus]SEA31969.1 hypothetical protein SAMN05216562_2599 [Microbulbifer marinus]
MEHCSFRFRTSKHLLAVFSLLLLPAASSCLADELFIPDSSSALNLQADGTFFIDSAFGMDNVALYESAENLRNNSMGLVHRRLNYQWLQMHTNPDQFQPVTGGKALNEILKMGWQTYREKNRRKLDNGLMRYTSGHGKIGKAFDYDVRLSDDKFKFSFEYEF